MLLIEALFAARKGQNWPPPYGLPELLKATFFVFCNSGNYRVLAFPSYFLFADKCLESHTILIVQHVPDMGLCELLCYNQPNCVSVNYEIQRERRCELNNSTHRAHDADFKEREGCLYHGAIVSFLSFFLLWYTFIILKAMDHYLIIIIIITRDVIFVIRSERLLKKLTQAVSKVIALFPCRDSSNVGEFFRR